MDKSSGTNFPIRAIHGWTSGDYRPECGVEERTQSVVVGDRAEAPERRHHYANSHAAQIDQLVAAPLHVRPPTVGGCRHTAGHQSGRPGPSGVGECGGGLVDGISSTGVASISD